MTESPFDSSPSFRLDLFLICVAIIASNSDLLELWKMNPMQDGHRFDFLPFRSIDPGQLIF